MAERRMFSKKISNSDLFLDMPLSAQALYFHLNMNADDDGFLNNYKSIMRLIGAKEDDFKILVVKEFVIPFQSGIVVVKHWKIHNYIQKDRYKKTDFKEEFSKLELVNNEYQLILTDNNLDDVYELDTDCIQDVSIGKDRLGKDRLGKVNKTYIGLSEEPKAPNVSVISKKIFEFWNDAKITVHKTLTTKLDKLIKSKLEFYGESKIMESILNYARVYFDENYYFRHKWTLEEFLKQDNAMPDFFDEGSKWQAYITRNEKPKRESSCKDFDNGNGGFTEL